MEKDWKRLKMEKKFKFHREQMFHGKFHCRWTLPKMRKLLATISGEKLKLPGFFDGDDQFDVYALRFGPHRYLTYHSEVLFVRKTEPERWLSMAFDPDRDISSGWAHCTQRIDKLQKVTQFTVVDTRKSSKCIRKALDALTAQWYFEDPLKEQWIQAESSESVSQNKQSRKYAYLCSPCVWKICCQGLCFPCCYLGGCRGCRTFLFNHAANPAEQRQIKWDCCLTAEEKQEKKKYANCNKFTFTLLKELGLEPRIGGFWICKCLR